MLKSLRYFFIIVLVSLVQTFAQDHEMVIPPWSGANYLNDVIAGDTTATGQRVDPLRVYVLQRTGAYFCNTPIRNSGWNLTIKAQDGAGNRPVVFLVKNTSTSANPGFFTQIGGNLNLKNVIVSGILEADTSSFSLMQGALIGTNAAGFDIVLDSCIFTNINGNVIRTDNAQRVIKVTNCIFGNMGYLGRSNLGAGKGLDIRAVNLDTLLLVNNTFVNAQDRIIRHFQSTAPINVLFFDHNTIVNTMSYHGMFNLGKVGKKVQITNSLFVDPFALGVDTDYVRQAEFNESGEKDENGARRMTWILTENNDTTEWLVRNNYYSISPAGQNFYDTYATAGVKGEGSPLTWHINSRIGADSVNTFKKEALVLNKIPDLMTRMMVWYRTPLAQGGAGKSKSTTNFNRLLHDYDRKPWQYLNDTLDAAYQTTALAYTGASGNFPAGDLNWFPTKKAEWIAWLTDVTDVDYTPSVFTLNQNYPNPFNPSTKISFTVSKAGLTTLSIYNILGEKVATLFNKEINSGTYNVDFNASGLNSGVYFYRLESNGSYQAKKMMLLK